MRELYIEGRTGISGDMFVAALLDAGADEAVLREVLKTVPVGGFTVKISRVKKASLDVCDFDVVLDEEHENHDHDMDYLYGHEHEGQSRHGEHGHCHSLGGQGDGRPAQHGNAPADDEHETEGHADERRHCHEHVSAGGEHGHHNHGGQGEGHHAGHGHHHYHRGMKEVLDILNATQMNEHARALAVRIFTILGEAEAKAHGTTLDNVHFHEVGAVDSIVDIISSAVCFDSLHLDGVIIPALTEGSGTVRSAHGILPVPVPAVANIAAACGLNLRLTDTPGELITPTGAAIAAALKTGDSLPEPCRIVRVGMGAGKRMYKNPSILRVMVIEGAEKAQTDHIYKLESNIDDTTGEAFGFVQDQLFAAGARDVYYTPIFMKKNRPAYMLSVICAPEDCDRLEQIIFQETTTIGIRRIRLGRTVLGREVKEVQTPLGTARVKVCALDGGTKVYPEYEDVARLSRQHARAFRETFAIVEQAAREQLAAPTCS